MFLHQWADFDSLSGSLLSYKHEVILSQMFPSKCLIAIHVSRGAHSLEVQLEQGVDG